MNLTEESLLSDCSEGFATAMGLSSHRIGVSAGYRVAEIIARSNFLRLQCMVPVVSMYGKVCVRNVPVYKLDTIFDMIISVETSVESLSFATGGGRSNKRRQLGRYLHVLYLNPRPLKSKVGAKGLQESLHPHYGAPEVVAMMATLPDYAAGVAQDSQKVTSPGSATSGSACTDDDISMAAFEVSSKSSNPDKSLNGVALDQTVVVEPLLDPDDPTGLTKAAWISSWRDDRSGHGEPSRWIRLDGQAASRVSAAVEDANATAECIQDIARPEEGGLRKVPDSNGLSAWASHRMTDALEIKTYGINGELEDRISSQGLSSDAEPSLRYYSFQPDVVDQ